MAGSNFSFSPHTRGLGDTHRSDCGDGNVLAIEHEVATKLSTMQSQWYSDATDSILKALKLPSDDEEEEEEDSSDGSDAEDSENAFLLNITFSFLEKLILAQKHFRHFLAKFR